ncbi:MAG: hypothetical protein HQK83_10325 [Fibrobacteria bacterium]|nr:hypothetical protein [Fibrobacteria bacterium]
MKKVKEFTIDLSKTEPKERLSSLLKSKRALNKSTMLAENAYVEIQETLPKPELTAPIVRKLSSIGLKLRGTGDTGYMEELKQWAIFTGLDESYFASANLGYELTQLGTWAWNNVISKAAQKWTKWSTCFAKNKGLCSSVAFYRPGIGMVHARNMDWTLSGLRGATCLIHYKNGLAGDFTSVGVPGQIGVLSGVGKGRFSATINLAPVGNIRPNITSGWSALLLLRYVFENCETYEDAVEELLEAATVVPVFIQIVGPKKGQACIIEIMPRGENYYWEYDGSPLGITNHEPDDKNYEDIGDNQDGWTDSIPRLNKITGMAEKCKAKSLKGCMRVLLDYPVWGANTAQSMVMNAKTGDVLLQ